MFKPKFQVVQSLEACADMINKPHEDYPKHVDKTKIMLDVLKDVEVVILVDIRSVHHFIFKEVPSVSPGCFRNIQAHVINRDSGERYDYPDPVHVPSMMHTLAPVTKETDLIQWYTDFQMLHPFNDGNGRVGGVVVAAMHYKVTGQWLAPLQ